MEVPAMPAPTPDLESIQRRLDALEGENQRLREVVGQLQRPRIIRWAVTYAALIALGWVVFRTAGNPLDARASLHADELRVGTIRFEPRDESSGFQPTINRDGVHFDSGKISAKTVEVQGRTLEPR
jgi:hypothetical protein